MRGSDLAILISLGAIWGVAFPLMRFTAPFFGPFPLIGVRIAVALCVLLAVLRVSGLSAGARQGAARELDEARGKAVPLFILGLLNTAIPLTLFAFAALHINAGLAALINSTTPMFGALLGLWAGERLSYSRTAGVALGFVGVATIVWDSLGPLGSLALLGSAAALIGSALYALAAVYTRRNLARMDSRTITAGSLCGALIALVPPAIWQWPEQDPSPEAWASAIFMGIVCTALGYVLYFKLLRNVGVSRATTVTFLVPVFGILWSSLLLHEPITTALLGSCAIVLLGTALATGFVRFGRQ